MTTLALCMAGTYRRFREAGYTTPKFLLPLEGRTVLGHIVEELSPDRLLLVANRRDEPYADGIRAAAPEGTLVFIGDTEGQAQTAIEAAKLALDQGWGGDPFVLHNIDTVLYERNLATIGDRLREAEGFIDVFHSDSPAYSYVRVDGEDHVVEMAEKVVISPHATTGLYGFSSPEHYLDRARSTTGRSRGEFYVSDVYAHMLDVGDTIVIDPTPRPTMILGTPAEYEAHTGEGPQ